MSRSGAAAVLEQADPYRYGWRYVRRNAADGGEEFDQVPLTLEDILHPQEEDFRVHTVDHIEDCHYLLNALPRRAPKGVRLLFDHRIDWQVPGIRPHGPDVTGLREKRRRRIILGGTYYVRDWGAEPLFTMEVTSPETYQTDLGTKVDHYFRAGVPYYIIAHGRFVRGRRRGLHLIGYQAVPGGTAYERMRLSANRRLWLPPMQLWLGVRRNRVVCYDENGVMIQNYDEVDDARLAERAARLAAEEGRAVAEEARLAAEEARVLAEEAQLAAEEGRAAEKEARLAAEERLHRLEAQLRRQPRNGPT